MPKNFVVIDEERCKGCGLCISVCPKKVLDFADHLTAKVTIPLLRWTKKTVLVAVFVI